MSSRAAPRSGPRIILTGGPGAGKSTVLGELQARGLRTVPESARAIIRDRLGRGMTPRPDARRFAEEILAMDRRAYDACRDDAGAVLFDRGLPDALCMLHVARAVDLASVQRELRSRPYASDVFFLPPWAAIYATDGERDQSFAAAVEVAERLLAWYRSLGFTVVMVPEATPAQRAGFLLQRIARTPR